MPKRLRATHLFVQDYDAAIAFFTQALAFVLIENTVLDAATGKRWVRVAPDKKSGGQLLLVRADSASAAAMLGQQAGDKVFMFLDTADIHADYAHMLASGVQFVSPPALKPHGWVAVFLDISGNRWDLVQPS